MKSLKYFFLGSILILSSFVKSYSQTYSSENIFYCINDNDTFINLRKYIHQISILAPAAYKITENGSLWGSVDQRILDLAAEHNVKIMPLIVNSGEGSFDNELIKNILENETARKPSIEMMIILAKQFKFYGWQFDIENLHIEDKELFTQYYKETAEAFHKDGLKLSAAVVHKISATPGPNSYHNFLFEEWRAGYDLKAMAEVSDFLSIMTYDQHTRRTPPGPVAGFSWVESVVKYMIEEGVTPNKISLGLPTYSVYWFPDYSSAKGGFVNAKHLDYCDAVGLADRYSAKLMWLENQGCYYTFWENSGVFEYLFLEDAKSFETKLKLLPKYKLRGISVWRFGSEDPKVWEVMSDNLKPITW